MRKKSDVVRSDWHFTDLDEPGWVAPGATNSQSASQSALAALQGLPAGAEDSGRAAFAAVRGARRSTFAAASVPSPADHVVLVRGMPVGPWMRLRPVEDVWAAWLLGLRMLWLSWLPNEGNDAPTDHGQDQRSWEVWQSQHVHTLQFRRAASGSERLAELLADPLLANADAHLVGHSVGGAAVLRYLTGVRVGSLPVPAGRVRTAITLDAALTGIAGVWSGMRTLAHRRESDLLAGLGAWAQQQGISAITICNERDVWSHRAVADLPYVGLRLGPPLDLGAQLNGAVHGWLRRMPQVVEALWHDAAAPVSAGVPTRVLG